MSNIQQGISKDEVFLISNFDIPVFIRAEWYAGTALVIPYSS